MSVLSLGEADIVIWNRGAAVNASLNLKIANLSWFLVDRMCNSVASSAQLVRSKVKTGRDGVKVDDWLHVLFHRLPEIRAITIPGWARGQR